MFRSHLKLKIIIVLWIVLVAFGFQILYVYSHTPGVAAKAEFHYPDQSNLRPGEGKPTLLIFGHPQCPCTRASIGELERLMPYLAGKVKVFAVFVQPSSKSEEWVKEALWKRADAIPGVVPLIDKDAMEARRFGAKTSGQTFLYDANGKLVFRGGITGSRGHMGDNSGRDSILAFLENGVTSISSTPVYGCSLLNPERAPANQEGK